MASRQNNIVSLFGYFQNVAGLIRHCGATESEVYQALVEHIYSPPSMSLHEDIGRVIQVVSPLSFDDVL